MPELGDLIFDPELLKPEACGYLPKELNPYKLETYMLVDTASGQKELNRGDDTAIVIVGIAPEFGIYGLECIADKMSVSEIEQTIITKAREYKVSSIGVEYLAAQTNYFLQSIYKSQRVSDSFRFIPIRRHGGADAKPSRHARLLPYLEQGRLKFPVDRYGNFIKGFEKLVGQMRATPFTERTHDDCIDALADVCAQEMGIMDGSYLPAVKLPDNFVPNPLMSMEEVHRIRKPSRKQYMSDFTDYLCDVAGIN
jgi:predicted phage terminase large subunit-like protein